MSEIICPHCKNPTYDEDALLCHFCGNSLRRASSGLFGTMRSAGVRWIILSVIAIVIIGFILTTIRF